MSAKLFDLPDKSGRYPFHYRSAAQTDLAETFRRERERLEALARGQGKAAPTSSVPKRPRRPA